MILTTQLLLEIFGPRQLGLGFAHAADEKLRVGEAEAMIAMVLSRNPARNARSVEAEEMVTLTSRRGPVYRHTTMTRGSRNFTLIERVLPEDH